MNDDDTDFRTYWIEYVEDRRRCRLLCSITTFVTSMFVSIASMPVRLLSPHEHVRLSEDR